MTIWKYELGAPINVVPMPKGAKILSVANQYGKMVAYALVDPQADREDRVLEVVGTGHEPNFTEDDNPKFLGTVVLQGGEFMFHIFERDA
jgi:hypothetical protein